jgi:hypothetical protein
MQEARPNTQYSDALPATKQNVKHVWLRKRATNDVRKLGAGRSVGTLHLHCAVLC